MDDSEEQRTQVSAFQRDFLLANSSISKDRTGGKKAEEDDSLRVLSSNTEKYAEIRNRAPPESSDESDAPPDESLSGSSSEDLQQSQTIQNPMQTIELPWHANSLVRPAKQGKKQKMQNSDQSSAGKQNIGTAAPGDSNGADHQETVKGEAGEKASAKVCHMHTRRTYITPTSSILIRIIMLVQTIPF